METGTKNRCVIEVTHVLERLNLEVFRKRVGPQILLLQRIDYCGGSEHY